VTQEMRGDCRRRARPEGGGRCIGSVAEAEDGEEAVVEGTLARHQGGQPGGQAASVEAGRQAPVGERRKGWEEEDERGGGRGHGGGHNQQRRA